MVCIKAAGGVLYRVEGDTCRVLLIYRNGKWDLPKGKREQSESIKECARREVAEEVGIPLPDIECFLTRTYHEYERDGLQYGKTTHWYKMKSEQLSGFTPETSEGITSVQWVELEKAGLKVDYKNLRKVLEVFGNSVQ